MMIIVIIVKQERLTLVECLLCARIILKMINIYSITHFLANELEAYRELNNFELSQT